MLVPDTRRLILDSLSPLDRLFVAWTSWENYRFCSTNYHHGSFPYLLFAHGTSILCTEFEKIITPGYIRRYGCELVIAAVSHGNMDTLGWDLLHGWSYMDHIDVQLAALFNGRLSMVERLDRDTLRDNIYYDIRLLGAVFDGNGGMELVSYLIDKIQINPRRIYQIALRKRRIDITEYALHRADTFQWSDVYEALLDGHFNGLQYMYQHVPELFDQDMFEQAIYNDCTPQILDWMLDTVGLFDWSVINTEELIRNGGKQETVEWVLAKKKAC